jgi:hypothetical protein
MPLWFEVISGSLCTEVFCWSYKGATMKTRILIALFALAGFSSQSFAQTAAPAALPVVAPATVAIGGLAIGIAAVASAASGGSTTPATHH